MMLRQDKYEGNMSQHDIRIRILLHLLSHAITCYHLLSLAIACYITCFLYFMSQFIASVFHNSLSNQHLLKTRPSHRSLEMSQTSELVGKAPKTCNSYPDAIFK